MKRILFVLLLAVLIVSCSPSEDQIIAAVNQTIEARPTQVPEVIIETVDVTVIVELTPTKKGGYVTQTPTPFVCICDPDASPTPSLTPVPTRTKVPTLDRLHSPKNNGWFVVNVDIAPGQWRSSAGHDNCYWARYNANGDILSNNFGDSGGVVRIRETDFQVEFDGCGRWEFFGP